MTIIDISPTISANLAVFPGDQPFKIERTLDHSDVSGCLVSQITTTLHLGAHIDAECHTAIDGQDISAISLERLLGPAQVIHVAPAQNAPYQLQPGDIATVDIQAERLLIATGSYPNPNAWCADFSSLSPELIDTLAERGVRLIGIDTPSVDPAESKSLEAHARCRQHDIINIEGLVLSHVPAGLYNLIALPLKLEGADASPIRAILTAN